MKKRLFTDNFLPYNLGDNFTPDARLSNYIFNVLRANIGEIFRLFDDDGNFWDCRVVDSQKRVLLVENLGIIPQINNSNFTFYLPLMKGKKMKECAKKLVEIGIDRIIPIETERCVKRGSESLISKMKMWVCEAAAQSGGKIPQIGKKIVVIDDLEEDKNKTKLLFHTDGVMPSLNMKIDSDCSIITGPEGGFSSDEILKLEKMGFKKFNLATNILRCETAPIVALSLIKHIWNWKL
jgi:16S rRNA (uracil1498-N3)-methyltransferase